MANEWIEWCRIEPNALAPTRGSIGSGGWDLYALGESMIMPKSRALLSTGISCAIPHHWVGLIKPRSSMAIKGITTDAGVIDADYRGEIKVLLVNTNDTPFYVENGDRIAQMVIVPYLRNAIVVGSLAQTERGTFGFGSTGR